MRIRLFDARGGRLVAKAVTPGAEYPPAVRCGGRLYVRFQGDMYSALDPDAAPEVTPVEKPPEDDT